MSEYHRNSLLYESVQPSGVDSTELTIQLYAQAPTLRAATAALAAIQIVTDAAVLAAEYVEETEYAGGPLDRDRLISLAIDPGLELEIVALSQGSVFTKVKSVRTRAIRAKLLAVAQIIGIILVPIVGPIPQLVISGLRAVNELTPDDQKQQLEKQIATLKDRVADLELLVERQVLASAEIRSVELFVPRAA